MDDIAAQFAEARMTIPDGVIFEVRPTKWNWRRVTSSTEASRIYGSNETWMEFQVQGDRLNIDQLRALASQLRAHDSNWKQIASIDHVLGISGRGRECVPVGFDASFVNWCARQDVSLQALSDAVRRWMSSYRSTHDIVFALRASFTNCELEWIRDYFPTHYRNMSETSHGISEQLRYFQGCIWGRKAFAFDFVLGDKDQHRYQSSNKPTLILDMQLPESSMKAIKGRPVNEIINTDIFGPTQTIVRAWNEKGKLMVGMTPEIIPLAPAKNIGMTPIRLAA